ncbi:MAG: hypothetical protein NWS80_07870 [Akkermansiaceae bacterium]|nr:hypothetical protein [Akkermansiaceae bacterium]MDP4997233.1 hypothetical protein [Akkermansiaceae bacterium]
MSDFLATLTSKSPDEVVISLQDKSQAIVIRVLESLNPAVAQDVLAKFPEDSLKAIMDAAAD